MSADWGPSGLFARRGAGVLLHVTSLPGGRLGPAAYRFVDWLVAAGQSWWQVLPLGPPDHLGSPYMSASAFAGWPGLLEAPDAPVSAAEEAAFREREAAWIGDWLAFAGPGALADQVRFQREWTALRRYANERGVRILGDVPIYVAPDGADRRAHPELFLPGAVAGVPPDDLGPDGQLWGNPLYDWPALGRAGYRWWVDRFRRTLDLVDAARVDHFRGFAAYWTVPAGAASARAGRWCPGPGSAPFAAARSELGALPLVAEDLGLITPAVTRLRRRLGFPGMAVLVFGFHGAADNPHRPANHRPDLVVYTGTHDTSTALGWWQGLTPEARAETGLDPAEPAWAMVEAAYGSPASLAIIPAQDLLGLDDAARMNRPGTQDGNWAWRLAPGQLGPALASRLRALAGRHGRAAPW
jgi:4-alpha-glucanotransferase